MEGFSYDNKTNSAFRFVSECQGKQLRRKMTSLAMSLSLPLGDEESERGESG